MSELSGQGKESLQAFIAEHPDWLVVDNSQMSQWEQCARKYEYIYRESLPDQRGTTAEFSSTLVHVPLNEWYKSERIPNDTDWQYFWNEFQSRTMGVSRLGRYDASFNLNVAQGIFNRYTNRWQTDLEMYDFVSGEELYWRALPNSTIVWLSKPDMILRQKDGVLANVDFKVSAYDINEALIEFDRQFLGQSYAVGTGTMIKKHIRVQFTSGGGVRDYHLNQTVTSVDHDLMDEWVEETTQVGKHMQSDILAGVFPKRAPRACHDFNRQCAFMEMCQVSKTRKMLIEVAEKVNNREYLGM